MKMITPLQAQVMQLQNKYATATTQPVTALLNRDDSNRYLYRGHRKEMRKSTKISISTSFQWIILAWLCFFDATRKASCLKLVFQRLNLVSRHKSKFITICSKGIAEPRPVNRWKMLTEDISNMPTQELARTNITCTYTQTRIAPKAGRQTWERRCSPVDV